MDSFETDANTDASDYESSSLSTPTDEVESTEDEQSGSEESTVNTICPASCPLRDYKQADCDNEEIIPQQSSTSYSPYPYSTVYDWQTRILLLNPGEESDELSGRLSTAELVVREGLGLLDTKQRVSYEALSYTWGEKDLSSILRLGEDSALRISKNLAQALRHFRRRDEGRYLWIDAVCINQDDAGEKSTQIGNMFDIYKKAKQVLCWLGPAGLHTGLAMDYLEKCFPIADDGYMRHDDACKENFEALYEGLLDLSKRPWVTRVWVRQEVFAASQLSVHCGDRTVSWKTFKGLRRALADIEDLVETEESVEDEDYSDGEDAVSDASIGTESAHDIKTTHDPLETLNQAGKAMLHRLQLHTHRGVGLAFELDIVNLLSDAAECQATDLRDRVYALLGMTSMVVRSSEQSTIQSAGQKAKDTSLSFVVDYTRSPSQVFQDLTRYILNQCRNLSLLHLHAQFGSRDNELSLPSWTPDWRHDTDCYPLPLLEKEIWKSWVSDDFLAPAPQKLIQSTGSGDSGPQFEEGVLTLQGRVLGEVKDDIPRGLYDKVAILGLDPDRLKGKRFAALAPGKPPKDTKSRAKTVRNYLRKYPHQTLLDMHTVLDTEGGVDEIPINVNGVPVTLTSGDIEITRPDTLKLYLMAGPLMHSSRGNDRIYLLKKLKWVDVRASRQLRTVLQRLSSTAEPCLCDTYVRRLTSSLYVPRAAAPGDLVVSVIGGTFPIVIRRVASPGPPRYVYIGPALLPVQEEIEETIDQSDDESVSGTEDDNEEESISNGRRKKATRFSKAKANLMKHGKWTLPDVSTSSTEPDEYEEYYDNSNSSSRACTDTKTEPSSKHKFSNFGSANCSPSSMPHFCACEDAKECPSCDSDSGDYNYPRRKFHSRNKNEPIPIDVHPDLFKPEYSYALLQDQLRWTCELRDFCLV